MNALHLLVIGVLLGCVLADPAVPQIPGTYYAKISVAQSEGRNSWRGGGIEAYDIPNGKARFDISLDGTSGHRDQQTLSRYDMNETFVISETTCSIVRVTGNVPNPYDWVAKATYSGNSTYQGVPIDDWTYSPSSDISLRLSVLQSDANVPVFYSSKVNNDSVISLFEIIYLEFDLETPGDWLFYIPQQCEFNDLLGGDANSVVYFANTHWDCADISCSSRVPAGSGQPTYECAEFVARSVAYGGYFPGLSPSAPQSTYLNWKGYDLCYTTHLADALQKLAGYKKVASSGSAVVAAGAIFGDAGDGSWSHTCVGIKAATVDCHNNAREDVSASGIMFKGVDAVFAP
jgi:hypothetical protein